MSEQIEAQAVSYYRDDESHNGTIAVDGDAVCVADGHDPLVLVHVETDEIRFSITLNAADAETLQKRLGEALSLARKRVSQANESVEAEDV